MHNLALAVLLGLAGRAEAASLDGVRFEQDAGGLVHVHYRLDNPRGETYDIRLWLSQDKGKTFPLSATSVTGDAGLVSGSGELEAVWDAVKDHPGLDGDAYIVGVRGKRAAGKAAGGAGVEWVAIQGGSFMMGSGNGDEGPLHQVTVRTFQIAKTEATNKQYKACVAAGACTPPSSYVGGDDQPVANVDWDQAKAFCEWVGGRLPSEAEWEYAARSAGKDWEHPWGNEAATCERAVMDVGGKGCGRNSAWPVCSKPQGNTEQGLCDMAGNAWEWTQDWYHDSYDGAPSDGSAWESPSGSARVLRGGSWDFSARGTRTSYRLDGPGSRSDSLGLRPAR